MYTILILFENPLILTQRNQNNNLMKLHWMFQFDLILQFSFNSLIQQQYRHMVVTAFTPQFMKQVLQLDFLERKENIRSLYIHQFRWRDYLSCLNLITILHLEITFFKPSKGGHCLNGRHDDQISAKVESLQIVSSLFIMSVIRQKPLKSQ